MNRPPKRQPLGRGLSALLPSGPAPEPRPTVEAGAPREVAIEQLEPNPAQPRKHFDSQKLEELAESVRSQGVLQPIVVSPLPRQDGQPARYMIVAGERRWRAAQKIGLQQVPVVVREVAEEDRLELALIENIQRADLNPIEEARAYADLIQLRGYTQEELAQRVGKDRSTISNAIRMLRLPDRVQDMVQDGRLSMGHARAILGLQLEHDMDAVATDVLHGSLSVRATEQAVRKRLAEAKPVPPPSDEAERRQIIVAELELRLRRRLGVRVRLRAEGSQGAGVLEVPYGSLDELDRVLRVILADE